MSAIGTKRTLAGLVPTPFTVLPRVDTMLCVLSSKQAMRRREFISLVGGAAKGRLLRARSSHRCQSSGFL